MKIVRTIDELRATLAGEIGLVPTMGALHDGHRSLFRGRARENELVVASLFVNPAQFDEQPTSPRTRATRRATPRSPRSAASTSSSRRRSRRCIPHGFGTWVDVDDAGAEGAARPGHFRGVATVCVKLFNIVRPQRAYFGQKDAQQAAVIRRIVRDLNLGLEIRVLPTVRDPDGLALSSRNVRLSAAERERGTRPPAGARRGAEAYARGGDAVAAARSSAERPDPRLRRARRSRRRNASSPPPCGSARPA